LEGKGKISFVLKAAISKGQSSKIDPNFLGNILLHRQLMAKEKHQNVEIKKRLTQYH
jgi:hypothetical protein